METTKAVKTVIQTVDRYNIPPGEVRILIDAYGEGEKALEGAIEYARERTRIYALPARWEADWKKDGGILVKRYRNREIYVVPENSNVG